ncbi:MAG: hypothetical protein LQ349_009049, partial [Xanthoria aureola]
HKEAYLDAIIPTAHSLGVITLATFPRIIAPAAQSAPCVSTTEYAVSPTAKESEVPARIRRNNPLPQPINLLTDAADADTGGTDLISCENVTSNARDFCCDHNDFCCDDGAGRFRLDTAGEPKRTLGSAASTATKMPKTSTSTSATSISEATAAVPSGSPSAPPLIPDPELPSSPGLSTGAKAGIGIGAALGAIIVLAAIFFLWKWRPSRRAPTDVPHDDGPLVPHTDDRPQTGMIAGPPTAENDSYYGSGLYEMPGQQHRELSGRPQYEMPARHHSAAREMPG